jgi:hypothetical protein
MKPIDNAPNWYLREDGSAELHEQQPIPLGSGLANLWTVAAIVTKYPHGGFHLEACTKEPITIPPAVVGTTYPPSKDAHRYLVPQWPKEH